MQKQQEIYPLSDTVKAEARFRVKTKNQGGKKNLNCNLKIDNKTKFKEIEIGEGKNEENGFKGISTGVSVVRFYFSGKYIIIGFNQCPIGYADPE